CPCPWAQLQPQPQSQPGQRLGAIVPTRGRTPGRALGVGAGQPSPAQGPSRAEAWPAWISVCLSLLSRYSLRRAVAPLPVPLPPRTGSSSSSTRPCSCSYSPCAAPGRSRSSSPHPNLPPRLPLT
ncbi:hypothetical protein M758_11G000800, partial [Ceratodon purpureus]